MIESPIALLLLAGLSLAGTIAAIRWGRRKSPPSNAPLATLSDEQLVAALSALPARGQDREVCRRITLLIVEEIERRQHTATEHN
jgi:hypothetical protein